LKIIRDNFSIKIFDSTYNKNYKKYMKINI